MHLSEGAIGGTLRGGDGQDGKMRGGGGGGVMPGEEATLGRRLQVERPSKPRRRKGPAPHPDGRQRWLYLRWPWGRFASRCLSSTSSPPSAQPNLMRLPAPHFHWPNRTATQTKAQRRKTAQGRD